MDQEDRMSRIKRESRLSSTLQYVLSEETKTKIDELLRDGAYDLNRVYGLKGETVYQLILTNDKLTEEDIIAISEKFRARGVNPNNRNRERNSLAPVHYAIRNRMRKVTDFFIRCFRPSYVPNTSLTLFFIREESENFWNEIGKKIIVSRSWNSEEMETESANFLQWLITRDPNFERGKIQESSSTEAAFGRNLQHLSLVLLKRSTISTFALATCLYRLLKSNRDERNDHYYCVRKLWYTSYTSRYSAEIVRTLLDKGAAMPQLCPKFVEVAVAGKEDIRIIKMLIDYFPASCDEGNIIATALLQLLMEYPIIELDDSEIDCYRQILCDLAAKGADVDKKNEQEKTPIEVAVFLKNKHAAFWLNENGANFDVLTRDAGNLLHVLITPRGAYPKRDENAKGPILDLLISKGCQVNAKDSRGETPLHLAATYSGHELLARKLIEHGADVNCRDKDMRTPLHHAGVQDNAFEMVTLLLENGANVNAKNSKGETLFFNAFRFCSGVSCYMKVVKVLMKWGAQVNALYDFDRLLHLEGQLGVDTFREFLEYGLDVNDSRLCNSLYENRPDIATLMEQHCISLKAAELHCSEDYSSRRKNKQKRQRYYEECLKEIETLKSTFIIERRTTLYDFLRMNLGHKCMHLNNEKLKSLVDSPNLKTQFPLYAIVILANYRQAEARKSLLGPAKAAWLELTETDLPDICIECVFSYLGNIDLVNMIGH